MTILEAFERVERAMMSSDSGLLCGGQALLPAQVTGLVSKFHGKDWAALEDLLEAGRISPDQYAERAVSMIDSFHRHRQRAKVEKTLVLLRKATG